MKIPVIKRIQKDDLEKAGEKLPAWLEPFLQTINQFIDPVVTALNGRLSTRDNFSAKIIEQSFTSATELTFNPMSQSKVQAVFVEYMGGKTLSGLKWVYKDNGTIGVTLTFSEGGSSTCRIRMEF